jgi:hypothetical protein
MKIFSHDAGAAVLGIDIEELPQSQLLVDKSLILNLDCCVRSGRHFDLVLCLETAQHVESEHSSSLVESLVRHGDIMLFSAALPGKIDLHHAMNSYQFSGSSGLPDLDFNVHDLRPRIWTDHASPPGIGRTCYCLLGISHRRTNVCGPFLARSPLLIPI